MITTPYHAKYFAYELTRRHASDKLEKLSQSFFSARVDLNPHQLDAALFAFRSPLSRGAILADEVGLGKTIEAGLIISQLWAERRRRILCIVPAALRKQWNRELVEKFFIESVILETAIFDERVAAGISNPFELDNMVALCSYQFARSHEAEIAAVPWDLVVIDEAHRLRNVFKRGNKIARSIRDSIGRQPKILLTATPLQNSLMELYGLVSFVDPHIFGNEGSFREQFAKRAGDMGQAQYDELRSRIRPICQRTLRRQVLEYIKYTNRVSITQDFTPTDDEVRLYDAVSAYLQRTDSLALPSSQRTLLTLVVRKILASSTFAIAATLGKLVVRLEAKASGVDTRWDTETMQGVAQDFDSLPEVQDELQASADEATTNGGVAGDEPTEADKAALLAALRKEAAELHEFKALAESITTNAKGQALLIALRAGFEKAASLGAPPKALIFTESLRTQQYLKELLAANGYEDDLVLLSGTNSDPDSRRIFHGWLARHKGEDTITGSPTADLRSALVEEFRDRVSIMIATETGAEGINLQFCNLVVNYDLPWNPQRIEQRIGRCHRYGQKHDVVVINFLNRKNAADQRVFQLLQEKFQLFDGVFGASDEVLGALESGVDFEKRVHEIYQTCRTEAEIQGAFNQLQTELDEQIRATLADARSKLLEHFDQEVHERLRDNRERANEEIGRFGKCLWALTERELADCAEFDDRYHTFDLHQLPTDIEASGIPLGRYTLGVGDEGQAAHAFRLGHPLAERLVTRAKERVLVPREIVFRYDLHPAKITVLAELQGKSGWLRLDLLTLTALETEEHLLAAAVCDDGQLLDPETAMKFFLVPGEIGDEATVDPSKGDIFESEFERQRASILAELLSRNRLYFEAEMDKIEAWAEDLKDDLEREIKDLDKDIKAAKRDARQAGDLDAKVALYRQVKDLESRRTAKRRGLFEAQDEIDARKERLIGEVEAKLKQRTSVEELFTVRWSVV